MKVPKNKGVLAKLKKKNEIKNYKNQNQLDLEKIIDEYSGYVYKIIENMNLTALPQEDKEEIIADTFFILWKNTDKLDEEKSLSSYIAGIVRNLVREKARKLHCMINISDYENEISEDFRMDMTYEEREMMQKIEKLLKQMKDDDVMIFKLYYYSARKIREIAKIMDISEFSVKSKLHRMRKKIKKDLEKVIW